MCLCLAIMPVSAFARCHCVVAVLFGSVIVTGSEATQTCFCEHPAPRNPVVQSRRKVHAVLALSWGSCRGAAGPLWEVQALVRGAEVEVYPPGPVFCHKASCRW